jgi:hypothetical protein
VRSGSWIREIRGIVFLGHGAGVGDLVKNEPLDTLGCGTSGD